MGKVSKTKRISKGQQVDKLTVGWGGDRKIPTPKYKKAKRAKKDSFHFWDVVSENFLGLGHIDQDSSFYLY